MKRAHTRLNRNPPRADTVPFRRPSSFYRAPKHGFPAKGGRLLEFRLDKKVSSPEGGGWSVYLVVDRGSSRGLLEESGW